MDYLILQTQAAADAAKRKIEANFLRYHADWKEGRGHGRALKNLSGADIDPAGKNDAELLDNANLVMLGEKVGQLNEVDGFTLQWCESPVQRATDSKYCFPLPEPGAMRDALLVGVPQPNAIETDPADGTWFPVAEEF